MGMVEYFNTKYHDFRSLLLKPKEAARRLTRTAELNTGMRTLTLFVFISGLLGTLLFVIGNLLRSLVALGFGGTTTGFIDAVIGSILAVIGYFIVFIPVYVVWIISMFIGVGIIWGIAKLLGGRANYGKQFGALVEPITAVLLLISILSGIFHIITSLIQPISGAAAGMLSIILSIPIALLGLYAIALEIIFTAEAHEFEMWRGAVAILLPFFLAAIVLIVLGVIIMALFAAAAAALLGGMIPF